MIHDWDDVFWGARPSVQDKPPYISSQQMMLLHAGIQNPRHFLSPDFFRRVRHDVETSEQACNESPWAPTSREDLFLNNAPHRLCLTTDAGIGKTTTLLWAQQQIGRRHPDRLPLFLQLSDLPDRSELVTSTFAEWMLICSKEPLDRRLAIEVIERLLPSGRLVLLVDALDQTLSDTSAEPKLRMLARFLQLDGRQCPAVVAGRPYAIDRFWDTLFGKITWRFAQLSAFNDDEQRHYLGPQRYEHLGRLDVDILSVPRALETIRVVPTVDLDDLGTAADVYCRAVDAMLEKAFNADLVRRDLTARLTIDDARRLLAMLAFEMSRDENFSAVEADDMDEFLQQLWQRYHSRLPWASLERLKDRLRLLAALNEFLEHAVLDVRDLSELRWKNRSLQEFFVGYWLARYADDADLDWIKVSIYQPNYDEQSRSFYREDRRGPLYWVWRFAAEMPEAGRRGKSWLCSMSPLYRSGDGTAEGTLRSTEMLYRSWPTMQAYAADRGKLGEIARSAIDGYQGEFAAMILSGQRGDHSARIATAFMDAFQPIPPSPDEIEPIRFRAGSPEQEHDRYDDEKQVHVELSGPFALNSCTVTNELYECFDPAHRRDRGEKSPDDRCPVIFVSWYDAWAFCRWLGDGYRLPTENEWEYACRAGTTTPFHYGDSLSAGQANFDGSYPYGSAPEGDYLRQTTPVGSYAANDWGLHDMHGNVWEWCETWYHENRSPSEWVNDTGSARVLRGGSWSNLAINCRSACRNNWRPTYSNLSSGFRVARARKS